MGTSLGSFLRQERKARGISLPEIASTTRVTQLSLRAIEDDRYEDLPAEVYIRGYLRAYASCVGLDPEEVVDRFEHPGEPGSLQPLPTKKLSLSRRRFSPPTLLMVLVWVALAIAFMTVGAIGQTSP